MDIQSNKRLAGVCVQKKRATTTTTTAIATILGKIYDDRNLSLTEKYIFDDLKKK
jgi:hypothetical protein